MGYDALGSNVNYFIYILQKASPVGQARTEYKTFVRVYDLSSKVLSVFRALDTLPLTWFIFMLFASFLDSRRASGTREGEY